MLRYSNKFSYSFCFSIVKYQLSLCVTTNSVHGIILNIDEYLVWACLLVVLAAL